MPLRAKSPAKASCPQSHEPALRFDGLHLDLSTPLYTAVCSLHPCPSSSSFDRAILGSARRVQRAFGGINRSVDRSASLLLGMLTLIYRSRTARALRLRQIMRAVGANLDRPPIYSVLRLAGPPGDGESKARRLASRTCVRCRVPATNSDGKGVSGYRSGVRCAASTNARRAAPSSTRGEARSAE